MRKILFVASEGVPFIKTGGLADVVGSLPKCIDKEHYDVRVILPKYTMTGALLGFITDPTVENFQPMGANFGVLPAIEPHIRDKRERYGALSARSLEWFSQNIT